jgi:HemY protein
MAELERAERNDEGRAREWIARALNAVPDPTWTAEGHTSERWLPVSPSGRIDAFEWRVPVRGIVSARMIEAEPPASAPVAIAAEPKAEGTAAGEVLAPQRASERSRAAPDSEPKPEPIIPLVVVPDDPGPEADEESDAPVERESGGWRKIFG